jgi:ABC-2 type transport system permease protein
MLLSALFVYFRDLQPIWEVLQQIIFYASPIILPIIVIKEKISASLMKVYMLNPLAVLFQQFRHAFDTHYEPSAGALLGSRVALLIPVGIILGIFALGFWVFNRTAPKVAEDL